MRPQHHTAVAAPDPLVPAALDSDVRAAISDARGGLSMISFAQAAQDFGLHLAASPFRCAELAGEAVRTAWTGFAADDTPPDDPRFRGDAWAAWPFGAYARAFLGTEQWWTKAIAETPGVTQHHKDLLAFMTRQWLDTMAPSNYAATNPEALARALQTGGLSLLAGGLAAYADAVARFDGGAAPKFKVGRDVAATPGRVVLRTDLAEVIQYNPTTDQVHPEPVVIVPAPIMKYYVLDLTPEQSMVRALLDQGFTVFMISWKNPGTEDRDKGFDAYIEDGLLAAFEIARKITGSPKLHAAGYCVGGTLLTMAAAALARDGDDRLASLSLLASQADFTEAGELRLFIDEAQVSLLEDAMRSRGYLRADQMGATFQALRANDLIWSHVTRAYLLGEPPQVTALDAWSADTTRLPYRFESQNLRSLYLENDLAEGRLTVGGRPVALPDIDVDLFLVATEHDHIAPWRSVYKFLLLCENDITFLLVNHGHNVGIVAPLGDPNRRYRTLHLAPMGAYVDPDAWLAQAAVHQGSWWGPWFDWLKSRSGALSAPPSRKGGRDLGAAPGAYVTAP